MIRAIHAFVALLLLGCTESAVPVMPPEGTTAALRVWLDPYADLGWAGAVRLTTQLHDHTGGSTARLAAYDSAGYHVVPLMDYSGVPSLPYALTSRLWPPEAVIARSLRASVANVRLWLPSAEEVGYQHISSPFLTTHISKWEPAIDTKREALMYTSTQEAIELIVRHGGYPILSHPWGPWQPFAALSGYRAIEMYNALAEHRFTVPVDPFYTQRNRNLDLIAAWDRVLLEGRFVVGVAVNDHHGPPSTVINLSPRVRDSGKVIVLADTVSLPALKRALEDGRVFAVRDLGVPKGQLPRVDSASIRGDTIRIFTPDMVRWLVNGTAFDHTGTALPLTKLPSHARVVRAEVVRADATIFLQAWFVRPRGDVNGDGAVDATDGSVCAAVRAGQDTLRTHRAACAALNARG